MKKYYPYEPVNIHIQPLINIIQEENLIITTKRGKGKLPFLFGNEERVIYIYDGRDGFDLTTPPTFIDLSCYCFKFMLCVCCKC